MVRFALFALCCCGIFAACDTLPIDPYKTFNVSHSAVFPLAANSQVQIDTQINVTVQINQDSDYTMNGSAPDLLKTSVVDKIILTSSDPSYTLDNLVYARLLVGPDTVAFDSIPAFTGQSIELHSTGTNIAAQLKNSSFPASLQVKLLRAPGSPVNLSVAMTIVHTAEPL